MKATECPGNPNPLGVARVVEIDTTGGPGFGFQHYRMYDFLNPKEIVLTFDDGPLPNRTTAVLAALEAECTKAIFFFVGKEASGYPEIVHAVAKAGHTVGAHTMLHKDLSKMTLDEATSEIEKSFSVIHRGAGQPTGTVFPLPDAASLAREPEVPRRPEHRRILDRHRQLRLQGRQGGRADQAGHGRPRQARQRHHPHALHPAAHRPGDARAFEAAQGRRL
ncbi:MAG: polysaccharide deacetylase family protein [Hyphomicrobium sp.]